MIMNGLQGKIIISTRPLSEDDTIKKHLSEKGAIVVDFPMIEIQDIAIDETIKIIFSSIEKFQWIVFTSMNGARCFFQLLKTDGRSSLELKTVKIAAIGKKTAEEVKKYYVDPIFISSGKDSADLFEELKIQIRPSDKILLPLAEIANDILENKLNDIANPVRINVYKTVKPTNIEASIIEQIRTKNYDLILFTSPSGFNNFAELMAENNIKLDFISACIGSTTEKELLKNNCNPICVSSRSEGKSFVNEIDNYFKNIQTLH
jgi:uroporphyrinogen-III synthase